MAQQIYTVSPWDVPIPAGLPWRSVRRQASLLADGQSEPIQLLPGSRAPDLDADADANAQVQAARDMGWPVILVTWR